EECDSELEIKRY
nr:Chain B, Trans-activator protein BZLF1 [human gammaherpesvirus 4]